ncbi:serine hydrolase domain-containing protein [Microbacterium sp.]|uniref:serine hydrolase domain-containing protein n=1 Tax=Microbacterium sp. TaxID=51671 RepID=UPI0039E2CDDC
MRTPQTAHRRSRRLFTTLAAGVALCALTACGTATPAPAPTRTASAAPTTVFDDAALQAALDDTLEAGGFPGVVARVITAGGSWDGAAGATEEGGSTLPTAKDHTRIGSVTKTMTATLLLQLVEEGEVSLDDPVSKYVPELPNGEATLRQAADMTSGIPSYTLDDMLVDEYLADPTRSWTTAELLDDVRTLEPSFDPGEGWEYSDSNYLVIGAVIEQVTGQPLAQAFEERLFAPLGMTETSYPTTNALPEPFLSGSTMQGSPDGDPQDATRFDPSFTGAAGGVVSTLDDLEKWAHALFTGDGILDEKTQQLRRDSILTSPLPNTPISGYGIGIANHDGWWGHTGELPGYSTAVFHDDDLDTTIIVVVNSDIALDSGVAPAPAVLAALQAALR